MRVQYIKSNVDPCKKVAEIGNCQGCLGKFGGRAVRMGLVGALSLACGLQLWLKPSSFASVSSERPARLSQPQTADIIDVIIDIITGGNGNGTGSGGTKP